MKPVNDIINLTLKNMQGYRDYDSYFEPFFNECVFNGKRTQYDACADCSKEESDKFYQMNFDYMCSGFITYHNGVKNTWKTLHHFYKRKP